jgi:hypothetical protein
MGVTHHKALLGEHFHEPKHAHIMRGRVLIMNIVMLCRVRANMRYVSSYLEPELVGMILSCKLLKFSVGNVLSGSLYFFKL